ncbi:hypothetical protein GCM10020001_058680 [Nonomuraea salmonea]
MRQCLHNSFRFVGLRFVGLRCGGGHGGDGDVGTVVPGDGVMVIVWPGGVVTVVWCGDAVLSDSAGAVMIVWVCGVLWAA